MGKWILLLVAVPLAEMVVLIEVGARIGSWPTVGLVVATAVAGALLLKRQGFATLLRGQARLAAGELPLGEVAEGALLAVAGALLLTPGFVTDGCGFALLAPPVRTRLAAAVVSRLAPGPSHPRTFEGESTRL